MYLSPEEYNSTAISAINIYMDYGLNTFPLNPFDLCDRMGIRVVPYSLLDEQTAALSKQLSADGYSFLFNQIESVIFYNDDPLANNRCRIEFTILHEIKHILDRDYIKDETHENLSDYFAKYMKCPIPFLIINNITEVVDIISRFGVSQMVACMVSSNIKNRINKYGNRLFEYEVPFIHAIYHNKAVPDFQIIDQTKERCDEH